MGADFSLATVPAFQLTDKRLKTLSALVKAQEVNEDPEADDDMVAFRDAAYECVQCLRSIINGREIDTITLDGADHYVWITGGMSWGDPPTDAYEPLSSLSEFEPVWKQMLKWARADFKRYGKKKLLSLICG